MKPLLPIVADAGSAGIKKGQDVDDLDDLVEEGAELIHKLKGVPEMINAIKEEIEKNLPTKPNKDQIQNKVNETSINAQTYPIIRMKIQNSNGYVFYMDLPANPTNLKSLKDGIITEDEPIDLDNIVR